MSGKQLLISLFAFIAFVSDKSSQEVRQPGQEGQSLGESPSRALGTNGMVSTAHPLATQASRPGYSRNWW